MTLVLRYTATNPAEVAEELARIQTAADAARSLLDGRLEVRDIGWAALICGSDAQKTYVATAIGRNAEPT